MIHPLPDHLHHADRAHYRHDSKPDAKPHIVYRRDVGAQTRHGNDTASCHVNGKLGVRVSVADQLAETSAMIQALCVL